MVWIALAIVGAVYVAVSFDRRTPGSIAPLTIGLAYFGATSGLLVPVAFYGNSLEFGPAVIYGDFKDQWMFWVFSITGAVVGAQVYKWVFLERYDDSDRGGIHIPAAVKESVQEKVL